MTPFFLLRMWLKRAPMAQRVTTASAVAVVLALVIWIAVPGSSGPAAGNTQLGLSSGGSSGLSSGSSSGGPGATATGGGGTASTAGSTGASGSGTSSVPGGTPSGGTGPSSGGGGATQAAGGGGGGAGGGTTNTPTGPVSNGGGSNSAGCAKAASTIKIGIILPDVGSGSASVNSVLGVPPVSQQQAMYQAVIDTINKAGGVECHPLAGDFQAFNELDSSQTQTICLQFQQDGAYAALGGFGPLSPDTCLLQNHIPTFEQIMISTSDAKTYYPYYFSVNGAYEVIIKNFAYAVAQLGYLGPAKGFKKLGVLMRSCEPSEMPTLTAALAANNVPSSAIDTYNFGCGSAAISDPPNEISQAELQFWQDGVTTVTAIDDSADLQDFTNDANNQYSVQHFKPYYVVPDDGSFATLSGTQNVPNTTQFDQAVGITGLQYGGIEAGLPEDAPTKKCDAIMTSHNLPTVYQSMDQFAGNPCDLLWTLTSAMVQDPGLSQAGLAAALQKVGTVDMSYPDGPNNFVGATWGGEEWREDVFSAGCSCFKAVGPNFNKSF